MLILLKQTPTGLFGPDAYGQTVELYDQIFFDTVSKGLVTNTLTESNSLPFEMNTGQLFYTEDGNEYRYDGAGGFTVISAPTTPVFTLTLQTAPSGGGTASDLTANGPYEAGESINLSATSATDFTFVSWTRNGSPISTAEAFVFEMPAANVVLIANFKADSETPEPEPEPKPNPEELPSQFYDLELRVRGIQIPMPPFVQRQFTNLFDTELSGDHSRAVTIPLSPKEMAALGLPNDPQGNADYSKPIPASIWAHGNQRYRGYLDILKADEERIRCSFVLDSGFFIQSNENLTLPQCYEESDAIDLSGQTVYAVGGYEIRFNYRDLRLTVNSFTKLFLKAEFPDHLAMLEAMWGWLNGLGLGLSISAEYSEDPTDETSKLIYWDTTTITACTLQPVSGTSRYTRARKLTSKRFDMEPWNQWNEANRIAFPTIYNRGLYEGNNPLHDGVVNRYDEQGRLYVSNIRYLTYSESFRWEHSIIPFIYLTDLVKQIFKKLKITVTGEFFENEIVKRLLVYNNRTLDYVQVSVNGTPSRRTALAIHRGDSDPEQESYFYENVHQLQIQLANHAPDYRVIDFLKGLKNWLGLKYDFNLLENRVDIRFVRSKLRAREVLDLTRSAGRVYTLDHGKTIGLAYKYANPDPLMEDGKTPVEFIPGTITPKANYTVQNFGALAGLDAALFETAFVQSLRAVFTLTPDQSNPPYWKLTSWRQQEETQANLKEWELTLYPLVDAVVNGRKMPGIEVTANNPEVNLSNTQCGMRVMAFYGQEEDTLGRRYAYASCTRYNAKEILDGNHFDLDILGADIAPLHADVKRTLTRSKLYETELLLDDYTIFLLSKTPIIRIANIDYALVEIEIRNTSREYGIGRVKLYKIK